MLRLGSAGARARCHACQAHATHQTLYAFPVDHVAALAQIHRHLAAAVEGPSGVFLVNQAPEQFFDLAGLALGPLGLALLARVQRGPRYPRQHALAADGNAAAPIWPARSSVAGSWQAQS